MGRKKISREIRKVSTCFTLSPTALDHLDEMSDNYELTQSAFVEKLIREFWNNWTHAVNGIKVECNG